MALTPVSLRLDESPLPDATARWLEEARRRVEAFEDQWDRRPIEQFVAADYELIYRAIGEITERNLVPGRRFCEWGCGMGVVAQIAAQWGWDAVGIEAEPRLLAEATELAREQPTRAQLVGGNFLPRGAERLADDPTHPSLSHEVPSAYDELGLEVDDFALIYAYPWPGEELFLERVFERYAADGALLMLFQGAYDLRLYRKAERGSGSRKRQRN